MLSNECKKVKEPSCWNRTTLQKNLEKPKPDNIVHQNNGNVKLKNDIKKLLAVIPYGEKNAMGRKELCKLLNVHDRYLREIIEQARRNGAIIINRQNGHGYYVSNDTSEILRQYKSDRARALSILARCKHMRKKLVESGCKIDG